MSPMRRLRRVRFLITRAVPFSSANRCLVSLACWARSQSRFLCVQMRVLMAISAGARRQLVTSGSLANSLLEMSSVIGIGVECLGGGGSCSSAEGSAAVARALRADSLRLKGSSRALVISTSSAVVGASCVATGVVGFFGGRLLFFLDGDADAAFGPCLRFLEPGCVISDIGELEVLGAGSSSSGVSEFSVGASSADWEAADDPISEGRGEGDPSKFGSMGKGGGGIL